MKIINVKTARISVSGARYAREVKPENVAKLKKSIRRHGMLQPIIVRKVEGKYLLIAGEHRLQAVRALGLQVVQAAVLDADDIEAEIASIEENLKRFRPSKAERTDAILRYKALWEAKQGKSRRGGDRRSANAKKKINRAPRTVEQQVADAVGSDRSTVNKTTNREKKLHPEVFDAWKHEDGLCDRKADALAKLNKKRQLDLLPEVAALTVKETHALVKEELEANAIAPTSTTKRPSSKQRIKRHLAKANTVAKKLNTHLNAARNIVERLSGKRLVALNTLELGDQLVILEDHIQTFREILEGKARSK